MLDRNRDYFTLSTNPEGISFKQDGKFFYYNGEPVIEEVPKKEAIAKEEVKKPAPKKRGRKPAKKD